MLRFRNKRCVYELSNVLRSQPVKSAVCTYSYPVPARLPVCFERTPQHGPTRTQRADTVERKAWESRSA